MYAPCRHSPNWTGYYFHLVRVFLEITVACEKLSVVEVPLSMLPFNPRAHLWDQLGSPSASRLFIPHYLLLIVSHFDIENALASVAVISLFNTFFLPYFIRKIFSPFAIEITPMITSTVDSETVRSELEILSATLLWNVTIFFLFFVYCSELAQILLHYRSIECVTAISIFLLLGEGTSTLVIRRLGCVVTMEALSAAVLIWSQKHFPSGLHRCVKH